jgi:hypothetical protein
MKKIEIEEEIKVIVGKHLDSAIHEIERKYKVYFHSGWDVKVTKGLKRGIGLVVLNLARLVLRS